MASRRKAGDAILPSDRIDGEAVVIDCATGETQVVERGTTADDVPELVRRSHPEAFVDAATYKPSAKPMESAPGVPNPRVPG